MKSLAGPLLVVLSLSVARAVTGAGLAEQESLRVFRAGTTVVRLTVTVSEGDGFVTGLERGDFELYENGVRQEISFFESEPVPLDVMLLLDSSSSMRLEMPAVRRAARAFMKMLRPGDRGAVVGFTERINILQDLTSEPQAISRAIESATANGSTALHNAIYIALHQFGRTPLTVDEVRRQAIVVLTDGEDTSSLITFRDLLDLTQRASVNVYTIGLYTGSTAEVVASLGYRLRLLARETGGRAFFPESVHELRRVYGEIAEELRAQYSIGYTPSAAPGETRVRHILVRLPHHPTYNVRTRTGYVIDLSRTGTARR